MALAQKGAQYRNRSFIQNQGRLGQLVADALDDIASRVQSTAAQSNVGQQGTTDPPSTPTSLAAQSANGLKTVTITHPNAPAGTQWVLQYASDPQFSSPITVGLLHPVWQGYLPGTVYVRVAAKFPASKQTAWIYHGSSAAPQSVS